MDPAYFIRQTRLNQIRPFRANKKAAFRLTDMTRKYKVGEGDFYALKDVCIHIPAGKLVVILGPSGSGESTRLNLIGGSTDPMMDRL